ncbi:MAG TPA: HoxN/HupN/NixA family nickel/cobalt transporter [Acidimicrobiales bacterium]|nr:HoxN/HupN/NixA family nickel/cobalt transporter [Acidimicrobiales bacterium]
MTVGIEKPAGRLERIGRSMTPAEWRRAAGMGGFVLALHVVGFFLLFLAAPRHFHIDRTRTFGIGTGLLAYTLGMRHAFDADHISAIDNTTRKLMSEGKRPLSVGFWFSLGHSSVVFLMAVVLGFGVRTLNLGISQPNSQIHHVSGVVGTIVSGTFLYLIAALNLIILVSIVRIFFALRRGEFDHDELERRLNARGLMNRFFGPLARRVDSAWKMYPIGFLFGLGFDTATEIALLVLAGTSVVSGLPYWAVLCLPILFAAGMSLLDTADGSFMNFAYGWAFSNPVRKVYYNITITGLSVVVAFVIGTIEVFSVLQSEFGLTGGLWDYAARFNINTAGFFIVGLFVVTWVVALLVWRFGRVETRWAGAELVLGDLTDPEGSRTA